MTIVIIDRKIRRVMCTIYKNQTINKNILFNIDKQIWKCYINHKKIVSKIQYPKLHKKIRRKKMRKRVVSILLTAAMSAMLFTGCSTPTEAPASSAKEETKAEEDTKSSSSGLSAATVLDVSQLPVTGIGAQIATSVKAGGDYKIGYIAKNTTNPYMVAQSAGVEAAGKAMGFTAITQAPTTADSVEEQVQLMENMLSLIHI